jgi:hypothetical protein
LARSHSAASRFDHLAAGLRLAFQEDVEVTFGSRDFLLAFDLEEAVRFFDFLLAFSRKSIRFFLFTLEASRFFASQLQIVFARFLSGDFLFFRLLRFRLGYEAPVCRPSGSRRSQAGSGTAWTRESPRPAANPRLMVA